MSDFLCVLIWLDTQSSASHHCTCKSQMAVSVLLWHTSTFSPLVVQCASAHEYPLWVFSAPHCCLALSTTLVQILTVFAWPLHQNRTYKLYSMSSVSNMARIQYRRHFHRSWLSLGCTSTLTQSLYSRTCLRLKPTHSTPFLSTCCLIHPKFQHLQIPFHDCGLPWRSLRCAITSLS